MQVSETPPIAAHLHDFFSKAVPTAMPQPAPTQMPEKGTYWRLTVVVTRFPEEPRIEALWLPLAQG